MSETIVNLNLVQAIIGLLVVFAGLVGGAALIRFKVAALEKGLEEHKKREEKALEKLTDVLTANAAAAAKAIAEHSASDVLAMKELTATLTALIESNAQAQTTRSHGLRDSMQALMGLIGVQNTRVAELEGEIRGAARQRQETREDEMAKAQRLYSQNRPKESP